MFTILYWHEEDREPRRFERDTLEAARERLAHYLDFDPDIKIIVYKDDVRLSVSAFLDGQEVAA